MSETEFRRELVSVAKKLEALGLNHGTSGNLSVRCGKGMLITPSGMGAESLKEDDIVFVQMDGTAQGRWEPSSEWLFHRDIFLQRPEFGAIIHTHSIAASALACMRIDIPSFHYMIAMIGGDNVRCAEYATFGTQTLSDHALRALEGRKACLLANHGMIGVGKDLAEAFRITLEVETLSDIYLRILSVGHPVLLDSKQMQAAEDKFRGYGKPVEPGRSR